MKQSRRRQVKNRPAAQFQGAHQKRLSLRTMAFLAIALAVCIVLLPMALHFSGFFPTRDSKPIPPPGPGAASNLVSDDGAPQAQLPAPAVTQWSFPLLTAITGSSSGQDPAAFWGFNYGVQRVNETGGIRKVPAVGVMHDTSGNPGKALTEMTAVAQSELLVFGPTGNGDFEAVHSAAKDVGLPAIVSANLPELREPFAPYLVSCTADAGRDAEDALRLWVKDVPAVSKLYIFYDAASPDSVGREKRVESLLNLDGSIVTFAGSVGVDRDAQGQNGAVNAAMAAGADGFYLDVNAEDFLLIAGALRAAGAPASQILGGPDCALGLAPLLDTAADAETKSAISNLEGVCAYSLTPQEGLANWNVFKQTAKGKIPDADFTAAADWFDAVFLARQAIETLGLTGDPQKLPQERERLTTWLYNSGEIQGVNAVYRIENGEKVMLPHLLRLTSGSFSAITPAE